MRRAVGSIAANSQKDAEDDPMGRWRDFVQIAMGSGAELSYHLLLAT